MEESNNMSKSPQEEGEEEEEEEEGVRVVVIQHVSSRNVNTKAIKWALQAFSLGPNDELTLLPILRHLHHTSSFFTPFSKPQQRSVEEEIAKRKQEYLNNEDIIKICEQCQIDKIQFQIQMLPSPNPEAAVNAANNLRATLVILDRDMKKYKKCFMKNLSCGIILMKPNNSIEHLKGPTQTRLSQRGNSIPINCSRSSLLKHLTGNPVLCPYRINPTKAKKTQFQSQTIQRPSNRELDMARGYCLLPFTGSQETNHTTFEQQKKKHHINNNHEEDKDSVCSQCKNTRPRFGHQRDFTYSEIHAATKGFCPTNFLSEGGFGSVYRGEIHGMKIAVKQHRCETSSLQGEKEFKSEVDVLGKARHENVVMLLGSCSEGHKRILVYEYVCNGSLDQHLSQYSRKPISWPDRIKVAFGAAKGLLYLHQNNIIHRDMRPNNILVTHDYEALLGDFGLARLSVGESLYSTDVVGTLGYMAPEYAESGKASTKTDVYSFGVILLQLITGMKTTDKRLGDKSLVGWVVDVFSQLVEGSTCSVVLRDCSPSRLDSSYDTSDFPESQGDDDDDDGSFYGGSTPIGSSMSMSHMSLRLPPSPPMGTTYSSALSSKKDLLAQTAGNSFKIDVAPNGETGSMYSSHSVPYAFNVELSALSPGVAADEFEL
ncbi:Proline-rich receptor-like protein kinase PERK12 [Senna tora]|uniref:Proline-rich receptor-like protein kinase PERK12 n=1 Tax=Senna tora TaxID=362788 RepID=A0A834X2D3_9FABA|nr:Proline-rich receptor-like protein kinase PERK12 [Senna tora]